MKCPYCGADKNKVQIRHALDNGMIKRKRFCLKCGKRFNTLEYYSIKEGDFDETRQKKTNTEE